MNPNNYPEVKCYECGKLATRLVWRSRCLTCVVKRIEWLENFECEKQARIYELEAENKRILDRAVELSMTVPKGYKIVPVEHSDHPFQGWIPLTHRSEAPKKKVLCMSCDGICSINHLDSEFAFRYGITHWMPLPKPPAQEEE